MSWTTEHGEDRLYGKYAVRKIDTGETLPPSPEGELVFVLRPEYDRHACAALLEYAQHCFNDYPNLSRELQERVIDIMIKNRRGQG